MAQWSFYGRTGTLETLDKLVHGPAWFFCRIQGRRRIGKTTLLRELSKSDGSLLSRMVYMQIPDSDERDVAASFRRTLSDCESPFANALADSVVDFSSIVLCPPDHRLRVAWGKSRDLLLVFRGEK